MAIVTSAYATFEAFSFGSLSGVSVLNPITPGMQERNLSISTIDRVDARKVSAGFYQQNTLYLPVIIQNATLEVRNLTLQTLLQNIQTLEGTLIVPVESNARQYTATYKRYDIVEQAGGYMQILMAFECSDSYGYDTTATTIYNLNNQTSATNTYPYTQGGSAPSQAPVIQIQLNNTPGGTLNNTITVGNNDTGQALSVTRTWAAFDLLYIDSKNFSCQANGAEVDFVGAFPTFASGSATIYVTDGFTSRNYRFIAQVKNRYI